MKKALVVMLVIISVALCWVVGLSTLKKVDNSDKIKYYMEMAEEQIKLEAYGSAIDCYKKVIKLEDTEANYHLLVETYYTAGKISLYKSALEQTINKFPHSSLAYEKLATYFYDATNYAKSVEIILNAANSEVRTEILNELYENSIYQYTFDGGFYEEASNFYSNIAIVKISGKMGYIDSTFTNNNAIEFDFVSPYLGGLASVTLGDESYFVDNSLTKYLASTTSYTKLWSMSNGRAVAILEDKYVYVDSTFKLVFGEYDYATTFTENVAAVKNGSKWSLIDIKGAQIGNSTYDDVIINENNICFNQGVAFVKINDSYTMINTKGEQISKLTFEDAKSFYNDGATAVKIDGKWGFINISGNIVIEAQYEDADAFGKGLAAVKIDGTWGFINKSNELVIENIFEEAKCFSNNGLAPVKTNGVWKYIKLLV